MKKLSLFDKILIFLLIMAVSFAAYMLFRKSTYVTATIKVSDTNIRYEPWQMETGVRPWVSVLLYEGLKEQDGLGRVMAEVKKSLSYDTSPNKKSVYLTVKLNAVLSRSSGQYTFKGTPLLVGSTVNLNLGQMLVTGLVTHLEGQPDPREVKTLILDTQIINNDPVYPNVSGIRPFRAEAILVGERVRDSQNDPIIEILEKKVTAASRIIPTNSGETVLTTDPLLKDVHLKLRIKATKINGRYFILDDIPVQVGHTIPVILDKIAIYPEVVTITEAAE